MEHLFAPIKFPSWWPGGSPVTSGIETHHILFFPVPAGLDNACASPPRVFLWGGFPLDDGWSSVLPFPLWCLGSALSLGSVWLFFGGFGSNPMCFCHTARRDSLLVLARRWGWRAGAPCGRRGRTVQAKSDATNYIIIFIGKANNTEWDGFYPRNIQKTSQTNWLNKKDPYWQTPQSLYSRKTYWFELVKPDFAVTNVAIFWIAPLILGNGRRVFLKQTTHCVLCCRILPTWQVQPPQQSLFAINMSSSSVWRITLKQQLSGEICWQRVHHKTCPLAKYLRNESSSIICTDTVQSYSIHSTDH